MKVSSPQATCKCCAGISSLCGVVDFSRSCENHRIGKKVDPYVGVPIYYYRCDNCGFVFTQAMDRWTNQDYADHIYNVDYVRHDPDYLGRRPIENAELINRNFPEMAHSNILDFGSGLGLLEKELRARGFTQVDSYDPYASGANKRPDLAKNYRTVVSFEVFEHHPQPHELMSDLKKFLADDGAILFSTLLISDDVLASGIETWWYCAPRNGHISLFSRRALAVLASQHGLAAGSLSEGLHFFYKGQLPPWVSKFNRGEH